jgi:hypothetical protein
MSILVDSDPHPVPNVRIRPKNARIRQDPALEPDPQH